MKKIAILFNMFALLAIVMASWQEAKAGQMISRFDDAEIRCLQDNIFWEARNQSTLGKVAVAWVTINRLEDPRYPDTICGVVHQGLKNADGSMVRNKCQFSWYCDGKSDKIPDNVIAQRAWIDSIIVAEVVLLDWLREKKSPVSNATMFHANYVNPYWTSSYSKVTRIGDHIFYQ
jgi:spore germination cell wall hydrolase CwlJ-like protein